MRKKALRTKYVVLALLVALLSTSFVCLGETLGDPGNLSAFRGRDGEVLEFLVTGKSEGRLWGTEIYTDDSELAVAAVHAGVLHAGETGVVRVMILPGQADYVGTTRFGVQSNNWGAFFGSFQVLGFQGEDVPVFPDPGNMESFRGRNGERFRFLVVGNSEGPLWGTEVYTDDSAIAKAAVHAGILGVGETGMVEVTVLPGQSSYEGSTQNGIESRSYGSWQGSYGIQEVETTAATSSEEGDVQVRDDPGDLSVYRNEGTEKLRFRVTGSSQGQIWGTDIYTDDSTLAMVCVHAGLLKEGETKVIAVTLLPGQVSYSGSTRNGITSSSYTSWDFSYSVALAE